MRTGRVPARARLRPASDTNRPFAGHPGIEPSSAAHNRSRCGPGLRERLSEEFIMAANKLGSADVVVVGAGNAAACAALAAREHGCSVIMLEAAPEEECGGNSRYTAGITRLVFNNADDIAALVPDMTEEEKRDNDFGSFSADEFFDTMGRITNYRCDPDLTEVL